MAVANLLFLKVLYKRKTILAFGQVPQTLIYEYVNYI